MVEFEKQITKNDIKELNKFHSKKEMTKIIIFNIFIIIIGILALLLKMTIFGIIMLSLGILLFAVIIFSYIVSYKNTNKDSFMFGIVQNFKFYENEIIIDEYKENDEYKGNFKLTYNQLIKVIETSSLYLAYIRENQAYVIYKDNLINGNLDELNAYFISNLKDKYIVKK